jgi:predicted RNA-binding protein with RPS1 domain
MLKYRVIEESVFLKRWARRLSGSDQMRGKIMDVDSQKTEKLTISRQEQEEERKLDQMFEERMEALQEKVIIQLEEKAQVWIEEMCKKRMESIQETIRKEVEKEAEEWVEKELNNRMEDFKR